MALEAFLHGAPPTDRKPAERVERLIGSLSSGVADLAERHPRVRPRFVEAVLDKYADLPMDFADATLVALAEELDCTSVFTTDRTDFSVYRLKGRKPFRLVPDDV